MKEIGFLDPEWKRLKHTKYPSGILHILVGPSGAGKSTYVYNNDLRGVVSSDQIRSDLCGDWRDQSKNEQVFSALHAITRARNENGLVCVVDATNIRNADRRKLRDLCSADTQIVYHVIDRPLADKMRDGGWRLEVFPKPGLTLIEYHHNVMQSNIKDILAGDGDPRVTVRDMRNV